MVKNLPIYPQKYTKCKYNEHLRTHFKKTKKGNRQIDNFYNTYQSVICKEVKQIPLYNIKRQIDNFLIAYEQII